MSVIDGHPHVIAPSATQENRITLCAECGSMKSILFLTGDRWYCHVCRNSGVAGTTAIPINTPTRRR